MRRLRTGPYVGWGSLDGNHHGPRVEGPNDSHDWETLRSTVRVVQLDNGMMPPPRFNWGLRLWLYAPSGRCWRFDIGWASARRYALSDAEADVRGKAFVEQQKARGAWPLEGDMGPDLLASMLGAHGLGLTVTEVPAPMAHRCETCGVKDSHEPGCAENDPPEDDLPEGLWERDGRLWFECRSCERATEWDGDPAGFEFGDSANVCGGSPRCLP